MSRLDTQRYVFPDSEISAWYHLPTFGDDLAARRHSRGEKDPETAGELFLAARAACCLERSQGMVRDGHAAEFPADADLPTRIAWLMRLPTSWAMDLTAQVAEESDLSLEDERSSSATSPGP